MRDITLSNSVAINRPVHLSGVGSPVVSIATMASHRGIFVTRGEAIFEGIRFRNGLAITGNGSAIWHDGGAITIRDCVFEGNQNGVLVARSPAITVERSVFDANGGGCGHTHGLYIDAVGHARIENCVFLDTVVGHHLKSRADRIEIAGCYFGGKPSSSTSCAIDLARAGFAWISRNQIVKTKASMSTYFIAVASESKGVSPDVAIEDNVFIAQQRWFSVAVKNYARAPVFLARNAYENVRLHRLGAGCERDAGDSQVLIRQGLHGPGLDG